MASYNSIDLGNVKSERDSKIAQLFQQAIPTQDSSNAILLDIFGMGRTVTIDGELIGTQGEQTTFINAINAIANGTQTGSTFVSSKDGIANKTLFIDGFDWTVIKADVSRISYILTLREGAAVA